MNQFNAGIVRARRRRRARVTLSALVALAAVNLGATTASAQLSVHVVVQDGDIPAGVTEPVTTIQPAFVNGAGQVGFAGTLSGGERFIWFDDGIIWLNSDETEVTLTGAEAAMGISDEGGFIYSPAVNGDDAVYTHKGVLLVENNPAPGFPPGTMSTFASRPTMTNDGRAFWVSGVNEDGGTTTQKRVLYTAPLASAAQIDVVLAGGDKIDGLVIEPAGIDFSFQLSGNGEHIIQTVKVETGSSSDDEILVVDGHMVAQEDHPVFEGSGELWQNFDDLCINNAGNYLFSGDTDVTSSKDEFIAYNGAIVLRDGEFVDGVAIGPSGRVQSLSLNNLDQAVMVWSTGGVETLFVSCDAAKLQQTAHALLSTDDSVDVDGDGVADAIVTDFNASATTAHRLFADDGRVYVEVDLDYGDGVDREALIQLTSPCSF